MVEHDDAFLRFILERRHDRNGSGARDWLQSMVSTMRFVGSRTVRHFIDIGSEGTDFVSNGPTAGLQPMHVRDFGTSRHRRARLGPRQILNPLVEQVVWKGAD